MIRPPYARDISKHVKRTVRNALPALALLTVSICIAPLSTLAQASEYNLPEFGEPADRSLPLFEERELGAEVFRQIQAFNMLLDDHELTAYIQQLGQRLVNASDEARGKPFRFFVIRDSSINAFALPGGYIGVHTGLIRAAQTEAELAGVLAHEIAHVTQRHIARHIDATRGWDIASTALMLAAIVAGGANPDIAQAAIGIGMSLSYQQKVNFTRAHELEADRLGISTLAKAEFDPIGMEGFFRRLASQSRLYGEGIPELLRTHPYSTTRMAEARSRREALHVANPRQSQTFHLMQARAELAAYELASDKAARFSDDSSDSAVVNAYAQSITLRALRKYPEAVASARRAVALAENKAQIPLLKMELARAQHENGETEEAIQLLRTLHRSDRMNHAATLQLANWELEVGNAASVRQLLLESEAFATNIPDVFHLLARAAGDMNEAAEVQYQMANWHVARGDWAQAIRQLRNAVENQEWDEYNTARLQGRLDSLMARAPQRIKDELERRKTEPPNQLS